MACTTVLEQILDDNNTIYRYNPKRLFFHSQIKAEYLLVESSFAVTPDFNSDVYLFIDKRDSEKTDRYCKSIFPKRDRDFTENQAKWTLLYKEKINANSVGTILYQHNNKCNDTDTHRCNHLVAKNLFNYLNNIIFQCAFCAYRLYLNHLLSTIENACFSNPFL